MSTHIGHSEYDLKPRANLTIWGFFLFFGLLLYITLTALTIYFKAEVEREHYVKVGSVKSKDLADLRAQEQEELKGIEEAMEKDVRVAN